MSPYREMEPPSARPWAQLAAATVDLLAALLPVFPQEWRWYRRAMGGRWERRMYPLIASCPESWCRAGDSPGATHVVAAEESWPR